ncbi:MAG: DUF2628 domain-containing protein [Clostridia bacterium]|nr:DUF2628 domain-containing protein [Clostridia bacterium]
MITHNGSCPYCEKKFTDTDDVVFCPDCGTPHHRECWHEHGNCANSEKHAEGFVWKSAEPEIEPEPVKNENAEQKNNEPIICPRCGTESSPMTLVCPGCGMRFGSIPNNGGFSYNTDFFMKDITADPNEDLGGFTVKEAAMYTQTRASDYVKKFVRQKNSGKKIGWNWAAFLFSPLWFFYRKIYKAGLCFMALSIAISMFVAVPMSKDHAKALEVIEQYVTIDETTTYEEIAQQLNGLTQEQMGEMIPLMWNYFRWSGVMLALQMVVNIAAALMADGIFKKRIASDISTIKDFSNNGKTFEVLILRKGGTSVIGLLAGYCIYFMINNILLLF